MRILKFLFVAVLLLAAVFVVGGFLLPDRVHVERATTIERSPAHVFAILNSYRRFNEWSPWAAKDPNASYTFSGPASGVGAKLAWVGDPATVGSGSQEITASVPDKRVETALDFGEHGRASAYFDLAPEGAGTRAVWGFDTDFEGSLAGRWMGLLMERMLAPDYEAGLANLKRLVETLPADEIAGLAPELIEFAPLSLLIANGEIAVADGAAVAAQMGERFAAIMAQVEANGVRVVGPPLAITNSFENGVWNYDAGIPVDHNELELEGAVKPGTSPSGKALRFIHVGSYDGLAALAPRIEAWIAVHGYTVRDRPIDQYINDPGEVPEAELVTHLVYPID